MQLDYRWLTHLLTTLRALPGAAGFLFGQPESSSTLGNIFIFFLVLDLISEMKWMKEQ